MPLLSIENLAPDVQIGLWRMTEEDETHADGRINDELKQRLQATRNKQRRLEMIAVNRLLQAMLGSDDFILTHETSGRPVLNGFNIGISHTKGYAVVILSKTRNVAVDIEYRSERVNKIVHKFMRNDEVAATTEARLLHWCAKETLYKLLSDEQLQFDEMFVTPFSLAETLSEDEQDRHFDIQNKRSGRTHLVHYRLTTDYVLTYIYEV